MLALWNVRARATDGFVSLGRDLVNAGLGCEPDLFEAESDATIRVGVGLGAAASGDLDDVPLQLPSKPILVRDLPSACQGVEWVTPTRTLQHAMSKMAQTGRSPLAVMTSNLSPDVSAVSWESIGQARLRKPKADLELKDVLISPAPEVRADEELLSQVRLQDPEAPLRVHGFVFVRDGSERICGIVTTSDLALQFRNLTNPYFQLGEIERRLRRCIDGAFSMADLHEGTGKRRLRSAHDMEFGDYVDTAPSRGAVGAPRLGRRSAAFSRPARTGTRRPQQDHAFRRDAQHRGAGTAHEVPQVHARTSTRLKRLTARRLGETPAGRRRPSSRSLAGTPHASDSNSDYTLSTYIHS